MNILQSFVFPNLEVAGDEPMYVRLNAHCWTELSRPCLHFATGGIASTDTFYNGLTVRAWKDRCDIGSMVLALEGEGDFAVLVGLHRLGQASVWLSEHSVQLVAGQRSHLPLRSWSGVSDGMLFLRIRALGTARLDGGAFITSDAPVNEVRLGLVITHFNRQAQVVPAIERIARSVLSRPDLAGRITLTVIDNSRNLALREMAGIERIESRNLGGTGGFVRGLLALIDAERYTHALFMDDDASCEAEAIARTFALLQHARDARLAVAGALLREMAPWQLLEKGARFDGQVRPLCHGLDVRHVHELLLSEQAAAKPDYGAWWFFAFPLAAVKAFPFPFFVRGDDIQFGLANRFEIATLNGVACLGEDFSAKHGPLTAYLDARYHLVLALLGKRRVARRIFWVAGRLFLKSLTSYHYTSARAVTLALRHAALGPGFFRDNLDMQPIRSTIGAWRPAERLAPIDRSAFDLRGGRSGRESGWRRLARGITLQGFLLPGFLLRDRMTLQAKGFHGSAAAVFRYRRVLYEHAPSGTGYVAEFDRPRFFAEIGSFIRSFVWLLVGLRGLRQRYVEGSAEFADEAFWRGIHDLPKAPGKPTDVTAEVHTAASGTAIAVR